MQFQKQKYSKLATIVEEKQGVLFCGAGISLEPPAGLPDWHNLRDYTLEAVTNVDLLTAKYFETLVDMEMLEQPGKKGLTPEYVASVIAQSSQKYFECFSSLKKGAPNINHKYIAKIAKEGYFRYIVTTNFDTFIEEALQQENTDFLVYRSEDDFASAQLDNHNVVHLFKLHGCIDFPETITATVEQETKGLSQNKRRVMTSLLLQYYFIFWGYSGADLKINLDYLSMVSMAQQAKGFVWNFYQEKEEINPHVKELSLLYKDKAEIVTGRLPNIFCDFIEQNDQIQHKEYNAAEILDLQKKRDQDLRQSLTEWAQKSLTTINAFHIVGQLLKHSGHIEEAKECYHALFEKIQDDENQKIFCSVCNQLGYIYKLQGQYSKAIEYFEKIKDVANKKQDQGLLTLSYNSLGGIYLIWHQTEKSLDYYQKAKKIARKNKDTKGLAFSLSKIGLLYKKQGKISQALECFEKAESLSLELGDQLGRAINLDNIGKIYRKQGKLNKALAFFENAKKITISIGDKQGLAVRLTSIASIHEKNRLFPEALVCYKEALQIATDLGDKNGIMLHCRNIAHIFEKQNNLKEALAMYEESYRYNKELKQKGQMLRTMEKINALKGKEPSTR